MSIKDCFQKTSSVLPGGGSSLSDWTLADVTSSDWTKNDPDVVNLTIKRSELDKITTGFVTKAKMKEFILALVPDEVE